MPICTIQAIVRVTYTVKIGDFQVTKTRETGTLLSHIFLHEDGSISTYSAVINGIQITGPKLDPSSVEISIL